MARTGSRPAAFITGGTTGIGPATARVLRGRGFSMLVTGVSPETLAAAKQTLPGEIVIVKADSRSISDSVGQVLGRKPRSRSQWFERSLPNILSHVV